MVAKRNRVFVDGPIELLWEKLVKTLQVYSYFNVSTSLWLVERNIAQ